MAFPYIGGQIPQPSNSVETAARSFGMTQKAIADKLALDQQKQYNKAYPEMLRQQMALGEAQLGKAQTEAAYAGPSAEANLAKMLADVERMNIENQYAGPMNEASLDSQLSQIDLVRAQVANQYQQARTHEADYARKMHELENWDLYLQGASGDLFRQMYAAEQFGGMQASQDGVENMPSSEQLLPSVTGEGNKEKNIFDKVYESQDPSFRNLISQEISPSDSQGKALRSLSKGVEESFLSPSEKAKQDALAKEEAKAQFELREKLKINSEASATIDYQLKRAEDNYSKLFSVEKGPALGSFMATSPAANAVDSSVKSILEQLLSKMQGRGALSDVDVKNAESTIPNRSFTDEGFKEGVDSWRQINGRVKEHALFMQDAINIKKLPTAVAEQMWSSYALNNPLGYGDPSAEEALDELMKRGG